MVELCSKYMKVTKRYFNSLDLDMRGELVFQKAKFIGSRTYYAQKLVLYTIDNLFIEVWYQPNENYIDRIEILENLKTIDLYIDANK